MYNRFKNLSMGNDSFNFFVVKVTPNCFFRGYTLNESRNHPLEMAVHI